MTSVRLTTTVTLWYVIYNLDRCFLLNFDNTFTVVASSVKYIFYDISYCNFISAIFKNIFSTIYRLWNQNTKSCP